MIARYLKRRNRLVSLIAVICCLSLLTTKPSYDRDTEKITHFQAQDKKALRLEHSYPVQLSHCLNLRLPGVIETLNLEDNLHLLKPFVKDGQSVRVGISFYEDNTEFWSLNDKGVFHLYHFIEFVLYAYTALIQIANAVNETHGTVVNNLSDSPVKVPWIHAPYVTREELKGAKDTNQQIADLIFGQSSVMEFTAMKGLEDNDNPLRGIHPSFKGKMPPNQPERKRQLHIPYSWSRRANWRTMNDAADVVVFIARMQCDHMQIGQMIAKLVDPGYFPSDAWSNDIATGLSFYTEKMHAYAAAREEIPRDKFVACYIDRQDSYRRMPDEEHTWLINTLGNHSDVYFRQLHMELYPALEQFLIASTCNLMVGVHGNGLSHQLWMKKGNYLVEYFWDNEFVWCYSILAMLMHHEFLIFWRGETIDSQRIRDRDSTLQKSLNLTSLVEPLTARMEFTEFLKTAVTKFKEKRDLELGQQ